MEKEITLRDLILETKDFFREYARKWYLILISSAIVAGIFLFNYIRTPFTYSASLTFMINGEELSTGAGGVGNILGALGIGGGGGGANYNLYKIIELAKSRNLVSISLFDMVSNNGKEDFIANHIIDQYEFHDLWKENEVKHLENFYFTHANIDSFDRSENQVLKMIHRRVVGNSKQRVEGIATFSYNEYSRIFTLSTKARSEELSLALSDALYRNLSKFYVENSVKNYQQTYDVMRAKVDSLDLRIKQKNYELLSFQDSNRDLSQQRYTAKKLTLQSEITKLAASYTEAFKSLEVTELALENNTPVFVEVDKPIPPLPPSAKSKVKLLLGGGLLGAFLMVIFLTIRKIFRNIMAE